MKNKVLYFLLLLISITACKDFLELQPEHQINDQNFYQTDNDFEKALVGVYGTFQGLYNNDLLYMGELTTDNAEIQWSSPSVAEAEFDEMNITPTNTVIQSAWNKGMYTISRCNVIINRVEQAKVSPTVKDKILGEAKFMRAFSYFNMIQYFGQVPINNQEFRSPNQIAEADLSLKSKEEVYKIIVDDLISAESLLPEGVNPDKGRASRGAVKTLLAKVYLAQQQFGLAANKLKEVIDSKQYSLVANYGSLFSKGNNNLTESIFEIKFISGANLGNTYSSLFTPALISMAIFPGNQQGSGRITPSLNLINSYEPNDIRKTASVRDSVPLIGGKKSYSRYGLKFVDLTAVNPSDGGINFTVLRYADVLLMYAEALNEQAKTSEALPFLNLVRNRAKLGELTGLDQAALRLALEKERRIEFLYEGHRWFDLVRTGRAKAVINAHFASKGLNFSVEDHELLMPIPQREREINPNLGQNNGY